MRSRVPAVLVLVAMGATHLLAAEPAGTSVPPKKLPLAGETFLVADRPAFVMWPPEPLRSTPQPWIWYAPTLPPNPDQHEKWMHERFTAAGVAVAGIDVGESYGSPQGRDWFSEFYREMTGKRQFAARPCLLGRSRGGLMVTNWAVEHVDQVSGLAGIYPVLDFRTYPGLEKAAPAYGMSVDQLREQIERHNPIARVESLAKARVPVFLIHGDVDQVVPLKENSAEMQHRYQATGAGDVLTLVVAKGQGHNVWT